MWLQNFDMDKSKILELVKQKVSEKIQILENLIAETRESNNDTKSSMGDKYETSREMLQQEINNLQIQLNENMKSLQILNSIQTNVHKTVGLGSFVQTEKGKFFIAVSLGEINFENQKIFIVSPESPLAKAMHGKSENDTFSLNNLNQEIQKIW